MRSYTKSLSTGFTRLRMGRFEVGLALSSGGSLLGLGFRLKSDSGGIKHMELREALMGLLRFLGSGLGTLVVLSLTVTLAGDSGVVSGSSAVVMLAADSTKDISVRLVSQFRLTASMIQLIGSVASGEGSGVGLFAFSTTWKLINELISSTSPWYPCS